MKTKLIFISVFLCFSPALSLAGPWNGWMYQKVWPTANTLLGVKFVTPKKGWAVGASGTILYTEDGGNNWEYQKSGTTEDLKCVAFVNEKMGWAVGYGVIIHTEDSGKTWIRQGDIKDSLNIVYFVNENEGWIGGTKGILLHTIDGGRKWDSQKIGPWEEITGIFFKDVNTGWVLSGGLIFRTIDGGKNWEVGNLPSVTLPGGRSVMPIEYGLHGSIFFIDEKKGWASIGFPHVFYTEDGGKTWKSSMVSSSVETITFLDEETGCIAGSNILCTENGGKTWNERLGADPGGRVNIDGFLITIRNISFVNKMEGWAVGGAGGIDETDGQIMKTEDGGKTWKMVSHSFGNTYFINANTGWRVKIIIGKVVNKSVIVRTYDGGETWTVQKEFDTDIDINRFFFLDSATGWAVGTKFKTRRGGGSYPLNYFIMYTTDGGKTWVAQNNELSGKNEDIFDGLFDIYFISPDIGWVVGSKGRILHTKDGGRHWERQKSGTSLALHNVFFSDAKRGVAIGDKSYVLGEDSETDKQAKGVILYTEDGGQYWRPVWNKGQVLVRSIFFLDKDTGWVSVETIDGALILHSRDGGKTWSEDKINAMGRLYFLDKNRGAIFSDADNIALTNDGGKTWEWQRPKPLYRYPIHISELFY